MQLPPVDYTDVLAKFYPTVQYHCVGNFPVNYTDIDFEFEQPTEVDLQNKLLFIYQEKLSLQIRREAETARKFFLGMVLGTQDPEQIRSYEVKYGEATQYLIDNGTVTPQLTAEATETGENVATLAALVVAQYDAAMAALRPLYGAVDGKRRKALYSIENATNVADLANIPTVEWGY